MNSTHSLARQYAKTHPHAVARRLGDLPSDQVATYLGDLEPELAAPVLSEMWPGFSGKVLEQLEATAAAQLIQNLDLTRTVALLLQLSPGTRERIISNLPQPLERRLHHAVQLPEGTVGASADLSIVPHDADATVAAVGAKGLDPRFPYLYVVDREYRLGGVVHRRDLDSAPGPAALRSIMTTEVQSINSSDSLAAVFDHAAWSTLDAMPVVDDQGVFFGVLRHKVLRTPHSVRRGTPGPTTPMSTLLDLGEVYWSSLFSAIEAFASVDAD